MVAVCIHGYDHGDFHHGDGDHGDFHHGDGDGGDAEQGVCDSAWSG